MIPKKIYYCAFGPMNQAPEPNGKLDGYQLIRITEEDFPIYEHTLTAALYQAGEYQKLVDYVLLHTIYKEGGFAIYPNTFFHDNLDRYLDYDLVCMENNAAYCFADFFGAAAGHGAIRMMMLHYKTTYARTQTFFAAQDIQHDYLNQLVADQPLLFENSMAVNQPQEIEFNPNRGPAAAVVSLTDECNMRCEYCFNCFQPRRSSFETVDNTCQFLLNNRRDEEPPSLAFFGGEPMLEYETIVKPIVLKYHEQIVFSITTNGTLLTEEVVDFLADHNVPVLLSIDGGKTTQNRQRKLKAGGDSFEAVEKNIPYLLLRMPETVFRSTLTKKAIPELYDNMKYAERMGFRHYTFIPNVDEEYDEADAVLLQEQFDRFAIEAMETINAGQIPKLKISNFSLGIQLLRGVLENSGGVMTTTERCGLCTTSCGVDVNGGIHACQENNSTTDEPLGTVLTGIDNNKRNTFLEGFRNDFDEFAERIYNSEANKQFAVFLINSMCPKRLYSDTHYQVPHGWYIYAKALFNSSLTLYKLYRYSANPYMADYLGVDAYEGGPIC